MSDREYYNTLKFWIYNWSISTIYRVK